MEHIQFDQLVRALAAGASRRSLLRRAAGSAMASPLALVGFDAVLADGKDKDKGKDKKKDEGNQGNQGQAAGAGERDIGHPCAGNQTCRAGLYCWATGPGSVPRCTDQPPPGETQVAQTVVQTNNQVCAGDCSQTNVQSTGIATTQTVIVENQDVFPRPPTYWIDVACNFDAQLYRTVCDCVAFGEPGAPAVRKITLPPADICAYLVSEEIRPVTGAAGEVTNGASGGEASAGTGGVANAAASGGNVSIGDVRADDTSIAIDASGGTASADASGGNNNIAVAGGGQASGSAAQAVELSTLTLALEGNVVPGKLTTYWVDTDAGRRPAAGPALVQVTEDADTTGAIVAEARICAIAQPQPAYDWFGQCTTPAVDIQFSLYPAGGDSGPLATLATNAQGRAHFAALAPGAYHLQPEGATWCYAESDRVDANGNVTVDPGLESHVWSFVCGGPAGS